MLSGPLEPGHDAEKDEMLYTFTEDGLSWKVRISRSARTMAKPSPEARIKDWFDKHPRPEAGSTVVIPDYQFDPHYKD